MWQPTDSLLQYLKEIDDRLDALAQEQAKLGAAVLEHLRGESPAFADELVDTFGDVGTAAEWLFDEVPSLGYQRPLTLIRNGEQADVAYVLGCIQHGLPA